MTGYVQMHLDKSSRECIFGGNWGSLPSGDWNDYREISKNISEEGNGSLISDITQKYYKVSFDDIVDDFVALLLKSHTDAVNIVKSTAYPDCSVGSQDLTAQSYPFPVELVPFL